MLLKVGGSGSSGNAYALIADDGEILLIECGIQWNKILRMINYRVSDVVGCVVGHAHLDHAKSIPDLEKNGITVFKPYDEYEPIARFGGFIIQPFELVHDVPCFGFYISHEEMGNLVYLTDTEYCKYKFPKVNQIIVECNYDKRLIPDDYAARTHVLTGHMELQTTKGFVEANKTPMLQNIILCHLSSETANPQEMVRQVQEVVGKRVKVSVARAGLEVELNKYPF